MSTVPIVGLLGTVVGAAIVIGAWLVAVLRPRVGHNLTGADFRQAAERTGEESTIRTAAAMALRSAALQNIQNIEVILRNEMRNLASQKSYLAEVKVVTRTEEVLGPALGTRGVVS
jgi:hypothetical protein